MASTANLETELLTEHFGYPPVSLLDDIINSVNVLAERALDSVERALLGQPAASLGFAAAAGGEASQPAPAAATAEDAHRHEIENGTHQLETLLCASIDRNFDRFELYVMQYILHVAPEDRDWIRLAHYEGLDVGLLRGSGDDAPPTPESVNALRRRLQASQRLNAQLHAEKARNAAMLGELRAATGQQAIKEEDDEAAAAGTGAADSAAPGPLAFLRDTGHLSGADGETPLATTAAFALSQLQALRALSTSLRNIGPDLTSVDEDDGPRKTSGASGWRRDRLEYVEGAARKHLEVVRGLELGGNGEVLGNDEGRGEQDRRFAPGQVESLEQVVALLGRGEPQGSAAAPDDDMDES